MCRHLFLFHNILDQRFRALEENFLGGNPSRFDQMAL
jgi:hypothetical protein